MISTPGCCSFCLEEGSIDRPFQDTFGVSACFSCKRSREGLELITKTFAREEYLLKDVDLNVLPYLSKSNPHKSGWAPMKLYLKFQVEDAAIVRHGSLHNVCNIKAKKEEEARAREEKKRKREGSCLPFSLSRRTEGGVVARDDKAQQIRKRMRAVLVTDGCPSASENAGIHRHEFKTIGSEAGIKHQKCSCGFVMECEEL
mmetsp:Transcript_7479/g.19308  ORF Transcript_7479/g.19308 Transcript_7479/m.19308 type:complete len:201 (-) Transcript_7479:907-1509(-)